MLFALTSERFETYHLLSQFVFTQNQGKQRTALIRFFQLTFKTASTGVDHQAQARHLVAQALGQLQPGELGGVAKCTEVDVYLTGDFFGNLLQGFQEQNQPLDTHGETDASSGLAAHLLDQAVVSATGTHGALGAKFIGNPFENGFAVVIQATDQLRVKHVRNASGIQAGFQTFEVQARAFVQVVLQLRCIGQQRLGFLHFAVEHAQRIAEQATFAVFVELVGAGAEVLHQRITVVGARFAGTQAVEFELYCVANTQQAPKTPGQHDQLGVDVRAVEVKDFHTNLMKLAITAFLRNIGPIYQSFCTWPPPEIPCSNTARTQLAVPSGRRVRESPLRSSKVYISFSTISVTSPMERLNSSVASTIGMRICR